MAVIFKMFIVSCLSEIMTAIMARFEIRPSEITNMLNQKNKNASENIEFGELALSSLRF